MKRINVCVICNGPAEHFPNFLLSEGVRYHVGCLAKDYRKLKQAHKDLLDRAHVHGIWGPWHDEWQGSYDAEHWGQESSQEYDDDLLTGGGE